MKVFDRASDFRKAVADFLLRDFLTNNFLLSTIQGEEKVEATAPTPEAGNVETVL